jgi:hypothetical protein
MIPVIGRRMTMLVSNSPITPLLLELKRKERIIKSTDDRPITTQLRRTNNSITFFNEKCIFTLLISIY